MALARASALLSLAAAVGCSSSPLDPSANDSRQLLPDGRYLFVVNTLPGRPGCAPAWDPAVQSTRAGEMTIRREGNEWFGRAESSLGTLELQLYLIEGTRIAGSIRGVLVSAVGPGPSGSGDVISLGASFGAIDSAGRFVSGDLPFGSSGHGRIEGGVAFLDRARDQMVCSDAEWAITPAVLQ
jgi:hypothetical protein